MSPYPLKFHVVNVFVRPNSTKILEGNPLGVVHVPPNHHITQEEKQAIANQFNLSETIFLHETAPGESKERRKIDIFLTTAEVPYAGHPVIGGAWLMAKLSNSLDPFTLDVKAGPIQIEYAPGLDYLLPTSTVPFNIHVHGQKLVRESIIDLQPSLKDDAPDEAIVVSITKGMTFALVQVPSKQALSKLSLQSRPVGDFVALDEGWTPSQLGALYFAIDKEASHDDFVKADTRMFLGGLEDAATGSASSTLAVAIATGDQPVDGIKPTGEKQFEWVQGEDMGRPSVLKLSVSRDEASGEVKRITLSGTCRQIMEGTLAVD